MDSLIANTKMFFQEHGLGVAIVVLFFLVASLVRANLYLVRSSGSTGPTYYALYENLVDAPEKAFCANHDSLAEREKQCNELDKGVCKEAGCCAWVYTGSGVNACVAGDHHGPVYLSDPHSELSYDVTKYVHQGKTYSNERTEN